MKVIVRYIDGTEENFEDVYKTSIQNGVYYLWAKRYVSLPHDDSRIHIACIPLTAMLKWKEVD